MTHYFADDPDTPSAPREVEWALPDGPLRLLNLAPCDRTAGDATALGGARAGPETAI